MEVDQAELAAVPLCQRRPGLHVGNLTVNVTGKCNLYAGNVTLQENVTFLQENIIFMQVNLNFRQEMQLLCIYAEK